MVTRREFLKLLAATTAALALPVSVLGERLELTIELDEARFKEAMHINPIPMWKKDGTCTAEITVDQAKMWQAVSATDQHGRLWTTDDGVAWRSGRRSFALEG